MRATLSVFMMLVPMAAQAIVVVPYRDISLQCRSTEVCVVNKPCTDNAAITATLTFEAEKYSSSFAPFSGKQKDWQRTVFVTGSQVNRGPIISTYRSFGDGADAMETWRTASFEERKFAWFGPELPVSSMAGDPTAEPSYQIFHTQTRALENPTVFKTKTREVTVFDCQEAR